MTPKELEKEFKHLFSDIKYISLQGEYVLCNKNDIVGFLKRVSQPLEAEVSQATYETLQKRFDIYAKSINQIDDYFEYMYKSDSNEAIKINVMKIIDNITEKLSKLSGKQIAVSPTNERKEMIEELEELKEIFINSYELNLPIKDLTTPFELLDKVNNQVQAGVMIPYLLNRADGVNGHYCIARDTKEGYSEFWHNDLKKWCSAGTVFELGKVT